MTHIKQNLCENENNILNDIGHELEQMRHVERFEMKRKLDAMNEIMAEITRKDTDKLMSYW